MSGYGPTPEQVSICIPVFNGATHLDEALRSARNQTAGPLEILLVDDCSHDSSIEIARRHKREDSRIRIIENSTNLGLTGNWERCVELARGEWVKFLFQDDSIDRTCVERLCSGMAASGATIGFVGRRVLVEGVGGRDRRDYAVVDRRNLTNMLDRPTFISSSEVAALALQYWAVNVLGEPTSVMLHRSLVHRYGGFDRSFGQICDWEFWLRVGVNEGLWFDTEVLATFRVHLAGTSLANRRTQSAWVEYGEAALLGCKFLSDPAFVAVRDAAAAIPDFDLAALVSRRLVRFRSRSHRDTESRVLETVCNACDIPDVPFHIAAVEWVWVRLPSCARRVINAARTLLRSVAGSSRHGGVTPGEEIATNGTGTPRSDDSR